MSEHISSGHGPQGSKSGVGFPSPRQIIETASIGFLTIDRSATIVDWNLQAATLFGWGKPEALGRNLHSLVPHAFVERDPAGVLQFLRTGQGPLSPDPVEVEAIDRNGKVFPVEIRAWTTEHQDGTFLNAFVYDATERRRQEEATARLASIVESAQDAIISESLDGVIRSWNRGAENLYGFTADEAVGRSGSIIVPPDRIEERESFLAAVGQGRAVPGYETVRRTKNGTEIDVALALSPITDAAGAVIGASTITRDLTEQRWLAETLDSTLGRLERALTEAREAAKGSRRFLADAAHQLRSPIAGIQACAETLLRGTDDHGRDRLLVDLVRETSRAGRLITRLLLLARLDQGEPLAPQPTDLAEICRSELDRARLLAPDLNFELTVNGSSDMRAEADAGALQEILTNLLDNARRHAATQVAVDISVVGDGFEVEVANDGPCIPEDSVNLIFERFVSLDGKGGSGLGLPIGRALAQAYGGDLSYRDHAFVLTLPLWSQR